MKILYLKSFKKQYKKLPKKQQLQFDSRLVLFVISPTSPELRNHPLKGSYYGYWSINISGDLRALYKIQGDSIVIFALIGTHSELYG
jgi:addiction module RelE/StbE family toxin